MIVARAWPDNPPPNRPHVIDAWPRVPCDNYDYRALADLGQDVISMDWDTACSREDLVAFAQRAAEEPSRVLVAPMRMYKQPPPGAHLLAGERGTLGSWNLARFDEWMFDHPVPEGSEEVHLFGFGMVYLPQKLITAFTEANRGQRMMDINFSTWHYQHVEPSPRIAWDIRPVHLHFPESETGRLA